MGRVSLVAGCQQVFDFASTASLVDSGEKQGTNPQISQLMCCGLYQEPFFSGAVALLNSVDDYVKGCHVRGLLVESIHQAYVD
jgi:hypothetical protein